MGTRANILRLAPLAACALFAALAAACASSEYNKTANTSAPPGGAQQQADSRERDYLTTQVLYATDRKRGDASRPALFYGTGRGRFEVGACEVTIPKTHRRGQLESPSWRRLEFREDPAKHIVLAKVTPLSEGEFYATLRDSLARGGSRDALVFVHGFNTSFDEAARRTAQLAYDLDFRGVPAFFSWPSQASLSPVAYTTDENNVQWAAPHLRAFLERVAAESGGARLHLVAHSMGNRALADALRSMAAERGPKLFSEIVLAAPDIDAEVFRRDLAPVFPAVARRTTLYASSDDQALMLSRQLHSLPRAGESGGALVVAEGFDTVDASGVDTSLLGHSYYAETARLLRDISLAFAERTPAERQLQARSKESRAYWRVPVGAATTDTAAAAGLQTAAGGQAAGGQTSGAGGHGSGAADDAPNGGSPVNFLVAAAVVVLGFVALLLAAVVFVVARLWRKRRARLAAARGVCPACGAAVV